VVAGLEEVDSARALVSLDAMIARPLGAGLVGLGYVLLLYWTDPSRWRRGRERRRVPGRSGVTEASGRLAGDMTSSPPVDAVTGYRRPRPPWTPWPRDPLKAWRKGFAFTAYLSVVVIFAPVVAAVWGDHSPLRILATTCVIALPLLGLGVRRYLRRRRAGAYLVARASRDGRRARREPPVQNADQPTDRQGDDA
jgi:hypothetical protein